MNIEIIKSENFKITEWSGGDTTEISIYPQNSDYKKRNFDYRTSIATIKDSVSDFTKLKEYNRILMVLENSIKLNNIEENMEVVLNKFEQYHFSGDISIRSYGQCKDFNLMFKKGLKAEMNFYNINQKEIELLVERKNHYVIYVMEGSISFKYNELNYEILNGNTLLINNIDNLKQVLKIIGKDKKTCFISCCITLE